MTRTYGGVADRGLKRRRRGISGRCKYVLIFQEEMGERSNRSQRSAIHWPDCPMLAQRQLTRFDGI